MNTEASLDNIEVLYENNYNMKANKIATIDLPVSNIMKYIHKVEKISNGSIEICFENVEYPKKSPIFPSYLNNINISPQYPKIVSSSITKNDVASEIIKYNQSVNHKIDNTSNSDLLIHELKENYEGKRKRVLENEIEIICENIKSPKKSLKKTHKKSSSLIDVNNNPQSPTKVYPQIHKKCVTKKKPKSKQIADCKSSNIENSKLLAGNLQQIYQGKCKAVPEDANILVENATSPKINNLTSDAKFSRATSKNDLRLNKNKNIQTSNAEVKSTGNTVSLSSNLHENYQLKDESVARDDVKILYENVISPRKLQSKNLENCDTTSGNEIIQNSPAQSDQQKLKNDLESPSNLLQNCQINDESVPEDDFKILFENVTSPTKLPKNWKKCDTTCNIIVSQKSVTKPNKQKSKNGKVPEKPKRKQKASRKAILEVNEWIKSAINLEGCETNYECIPDSEDESFLGEKCKKKIPCLFCSRKFVYFSYFKNHMFKVHPEANEILNS